MKVVDCFTGGKQLNLLGGEAKLDFNVPDSAKGKKTLEVEVCSVHLKQTPLLLSITDGEPFPIEVPYTLGEWGETKGVQVTRYLWSMVYGIAGYKESQSELRVG
jgi:hypothetical protein